jgi:ferritin-like metal-binding protein YciE
MSQDVAEARTIDPRFAHLREDQRELLGSYVSDVVALDSDIESVLDRQLGLTKSDTLAGPLVRGFHDSVRDQRNMMIDLRDALGEEQTVNTLKEKGATLLGAVTGVIDKLRSESIAKALRDDYTAFNLAAVSYTMLLTTAKAVGSTEVATAAEKGLKTYASAAQKINQAIPTVVVAELAGKSQVTVGSEIADEVRTIADGIWKATDQSNGPASKPF